MNSSMNAKRSNSRRPRPQRNKNRGQRGNTSIKRYIDGGRLEVPLEPPTVDYQQWIRTVIMYHVTSATEMTPNGLRDKLKTQMDPTKRGFNQTTSGDGRLVFQFKLLAVKVWNLTGKYLTLSVDDYLDTISANDGRDQLCGLVDTSSDRSTPRLGFRLPSTHRHCVIRSDDKEGAVILYYAAGADRDDILVQAEVEWRFDGPAKFQKGPVHSLFHMEEITDEIAKSVREIKDQSKPSMIGTVIRGAAVAAEVVSVAPDSVDAVASKLDDVLKELQALRLCQQKSQNLMLTDSRESSLFEEIP